MFFCGAQGYVVWEGTQCFPGYTEYPDGQRSYSGAKLALIGDMKKMSTDYIRAARIYQYGVSMFVGVGIPFPVLDEDLCAQLSKGNDELYTEVSDYSVPMRSRPILRERVSFAELRSGFVEIQGKKIPTAPMTSLKKSRDIANELKRQVQAGEFLLTEPSAKLELDTVKHVLHASDEA